MFSRIITMALAALAVSSALVAQDAPNAVDLDKRVRDLEARVQQMQASAPAPSLAEIERQIEILTREIEALKTQQSTKEVAADTQQYGLGAAASKVYRAEPGISIGGYGEMTYQNLDGRQNADRADLLRGVLYTGYKFTDKVLFNSELEVEHASTESGGAVSMEFAYLDFLQRPAFNYRAGLVLLPVGLINEQHEPTAYLGASRPAVERLIIPATWGEIGAGIFGEARNISYRAYVVTGLNAAHFDSAEGIREGRQAGGEALANDFAIVGRADWKPFEGTMFGGSLYSGSAGQRQDFSGRVVLGEVHADAKFRGASLRALFARGTIGDTARINEVNGLTGDESVADSFGGWYAEGGYDVAALMGKGWSLTPYLRYEQLDTQRSVPAGYSRNPANDQKIFTAGVAFKPIPQTVIKIDRQNVSNRAGTGVSKWNVALGYIF